MAVNLYDDETKQRILSVLKNFRVRFLPIFQKNRQSIRIILRSCISAYCIHYRKFSK